MIVITLDASYAELSRLDEFMHRLLPPPLDVLRPAVQLAVHELCINIIEHAYAGSTGTITISGEIREQVLTLILRDTAARIYDPPALPPDTPSPVLLPEGGWGMAIVHTTMDLVTYQPLPTGNEWRLTKRLMGEGGTMAQPVTRRTLLVVDDEVITHKLITYTLKPLNIDVIGAEDGESALRLLREHPVQLIFMDINLPGTDGFSLIRRLRELPGLAAVPLVIITGRDHPDDTARAQELGASQFLYKPFSTGELRELVRSMLSMG